MQGQSLSRTPGMYIYIVNRPSSFEKMSRVDEEGESTPENEIGRGLVHHIIERAYYHIIFYILFYLCLLDLSFFLSLLFFYYSSFVRDAQKEPFDTHFYLA